MNEMKKNINFNKKYWTPFIFKKKKMDRRIVWKVSQLKFVPC